MVNRKNILKRIFRLFHTVRYLKPIQIFYRLKYRLTTPYDGGGVHNFSIRKKGGGGVAFLAKSNSFDAETGFTFLNQTFQLSVATDWQQITDDKLWLYNLHYFDFLNSQDTDRWFKEHVEIIQGWISDNSRVEGEGWEPYPASLRITNWIKYFIRLDLVNENFHENLVRQARFLSRRCEYHLLGNHLFANAKALIFVGLYFEGDEAKLWFDKGMAIVKSEIKEQVLADGGNFELSPMYHNIFLEDVLDIINLLRIYNQDVSPLFVRQATKMLTWMDHMTHPDGFVSFFNDSAINIAPTSEELESYAALLGVQNPENGKSEVIYLKESGYVSIASGDAYAILDIGNVGPDYLPGHAHADSLSFELSLFEKRVFVNSGTSVYGDSNERLRQRGTAAHNCLTIDGENSSEVWGGFRVARRARIKDIHIHEASVNKLISASHSGYERLKGRPVHTREWQFKDNKLQVSDTVSSTRDHEVALYYHIHPDWHVQAVGKTVEITFKQFKVIMEFEQDGELSVENGSYHLEFGVDISNKKIVYRQRIVCSTKIRTEISWEKL